MKDDYPDKRFPEFGEVHEPSGHAPTVDEIMAESDQASEDAEVYADPTPVLANRIWSEWVVGYNHRQISVRLNANPRYVAKTIRDRTKETKPQNDEERGERAAKYIGAAETILVQLMTQIVPKEDEEEGKKKPDIAVVKQAITVLDRLAKLTGADEPKKYDNTHSEKIPSSLEEWTAKLLSAGFSQAVVDDVTRRPGRPAPKGE